MGTDHDAAARHSLAHVVVGVSHQIDADAPSQECAEALSRRTGQVDVDGVVGQAVFTVGLGNLAAEHGADGPVGVNDREVYPDRLLVPQRRLGLGNQLVVQGLVQTVVLFPVAVDRLIGVVGFLSMEQPGEIHSLGLPVVHGFFGVQDVGASNHFGDGPEPQPGHDLPHLLGDKGEVVDQILRLAGEQLAQLRVLGGDAHRTGVHMALAQHDATADHQSRGCEADFFRAQQSGHRGVPAGLELTVGLHHDAAPQAIGHQHLLGLGDAQFPGQPSVLDGRLGRSAGASVVAADQHHVRVALGHTGGDGPHADLRHQFHVDPGVGVDVL